MDLFVPSSSFVFFLLNLLGTQPLSSLECLRPIAHNHFIVYADLFQDFSSHDIHIDIDDVV
jgi:hypothetical protein